MAVQLAQIRLSYGADEVLEDVWRWNPDELLLRDYYANSLLTFDEVKFRGWPERKPRIGEALDAPASTHVSTA